MSPLRALHPAVALLLALLLVACGQAAGNPPRQEASPTTDASLNTPGATAAPAPTGDLEGAVDGHGAVDESPAPSSTEGVAATPTEAPTTSPAGSPTATLVEPTAATPGSVASTASPAADSTEIPTAQSGDTAAPSGADTEPPTWPDRGPRLGARARTATTMTLAWEPAADAGGPVTYEIYSATVPEKEADRDTLSSRLALIGVSSTELFTVTGLQEITFYAFKVRALDAAGNATVMSPPLVLRTGDETPPSAPSNLELVEEWTYSDQLYLRWAPSTDNMLVVQYEVFLDGTRYDSVFYETQGQLFGVEPYRTYEITVVAVDLDGNRSTPSAPIRAATHDTTPPEGVRHETVTVTRGASQATITWAAASDDKGPVSYAIFRDGLDNLIGATDQPTLTITGLRPDETFYIYIFARDGAGNQAFSHAPAEVPSFQP